ncbi:hypothetical protein BKA62DRAFT_695463 [Auriculariales sp. MPI-PUGE-AT-0066]|nr:hypothetical protein BKA62DRAFT_695463 [Auriculariales sp. MPI-PUGE-AT-0066]
MTQGSTARGLSAENGRLRLCIHACPPTAMATPAILNVHTPTSSFSIIHSRACALGLDWGEGGGVTDSLTGCGAVHDDNIVALFNTLSRKANGGTGGARVGAGWLKYEWSDAVWNLDDASDYAIWVFRLTGKLPKSGTGGPSPSTSTSTAAAAPGNEIVVSPTLHMHNPKQPLPEPDEAVTYVNSTYYVYARATATVPSSRPSSRAKSLQSVGTGRSRRTVKAEPEEDALSVYKKRFQDFHAQNGVRTVFGRIGPVSSVRMLIKTGYRHVYMSRTFAAANRFIPADATPGHYGYGGLVNIGQWPITVGQKTITLPVYLSEETHFDVVLGRSFQEKRMVRTNATDVTDVVFGDTGEKVDVEVVIIRDGKGEIVTVT